MPEAYAAQGAVAYEILGNPSSEICSNMLLLYQAVCNITKDSVTPDTNLCLS